MSDETNLIALLRGGKTKEVEAAIKDGADLTSNGATAIYLAIKKGMETAVSMMLDHGVDANSTYMREPILFEAVRHPEYGVGCLKRLLEAGADPLAKTNEGWNLLMNASSMENIEALAVLLKTPAVKYINSKNSTKETALILAAQKGNVEIIRLLVSAGAHFEAKEEDGGTALAWAAKMGSKEVCKELIALGAKVKTKDVFGCCPLGQAANEGYVEVMNLLVSHGSKINPKSGLPPLLAAVDTNFDNDVAVKWLLDKGADVNVRSPEGDTPLIIASRLGMMDSVKVLTSYGADLSFRNQEGLTAMESVNSEEYPDVFDFLRSKWESIDLIHEAKSGTVRVKKKL